MSLGISTLIYYVLYNEFSVSVSKIKMWTAWKISVEMYAHN